MNSTENFQSLIAAASGTGGLSGDAVKSLGFLAENIRTPETSLEDLLERIPIKDSGDLEKLRSLQREARSNPYLD